MLINILFILLFINIPKDKLYLYYFIHYYLTVNYHCRRTVRTEPLEVFAIKNAKNIEGVIPLLDVFMIPNGYVLVMDTAPPTAKSIFKYALENSAISK